MHSKYDLGYYTVGQWNPYHCPSATQQTISVYTVQYIKRKKNHVDGQSAIILFLETPYLLQQLGLPQFT